MGNVLVYVETSEGRVAPISFELLGAARTLAAASRAVEPERIHINSERAEVP